MMEEYICQRWKRVGGVCTAVDRPDMCLIMLEAKGCTLSNLNEGPQDLHLPGWSEAGFWGLAFEGSVAAHKCFWRHG